jgi:Protein of unknown function (DUF992)
MKRVTYLVPAMLALAFAAPAQASPNGVKVGILTCQVESGWGYVLGSSKNIDCNYRPNQGEADRYTGSISKFGVDIGYTDHGVIVWDVVAPTSDTRPGALEGGYAGATASATVGAGIGANVLLGGFDKSIALQPVSVEGNTGLDVSAGIGAMRLKSAPRTIPASMKESQATPVPAPAVETRPAHPVKRVRHAAYHRHAATHCTCEDKSR